MTIKQLQTQITNQLQNHVFNPDFEADLLLAYALKKDKSFLYSHPEYKVPKRKINKLEKLAYRRQQKEPFAYLVGKKEFFGLEFKVDKNVLIPRPETELLVEQAIDCFKIQASGFKTVVDVGTGSGAIIISLVHRLLSLRATARLHRQTKQSRHTKDRHAADAARPPAQADDDINFIAVDISKKALKVARSNTKNILGPESPIQFKKGDLLSPILKNKESIEHPLMIVANLPYLTPNVSRKPDLKYEPNVALDGGKGGYNLIEKLFKQAKNFVQTEDIMLLEIGAEQGQEIKNLFQKYLPQAKIKIIKDYSQSDRVAVVQI